MESVIPPSAGEIISGLGNSDQPPLNSSLAELSNLSTEDMELFRNSWADIKTERRRWIMKRLIEMAEDNLQLNFDGILKYCLKDPDEEVRSDAIEGLWESEDPALINPLISLLEQDSSEKVQAAAATALGKFSMLAEHGKLRSGYVSAIQEALLKASNDEEKPVPVRSRALEAAAPLSLPEVKQAITEAYKSRNPGLRVSSVYAMGRNCDPDWLPVLIQELDSNDTRIRYEAAGACGELEEEEAVPGLIKLLDDPDTDVQIAAIQALGKVGSIEAKECLQDCLNSEDGIIRQTAEQVLNEMKAGEDPLFFPL